MNDGKGEWIGRLLEPLRDMPYRVRSLLSKRPRVRMLYLEVTHRCNARCITCYTGAGREKDDVLTLDEKKIGRPTGETNGRPYGVPERQW